MTGSLVIGSLVESSLATMSLAIHESDMTGNAVGKLDKYEFWFDLS